MKKVLIVLALVAVLAGGTLANAFDLGVGIRYSGLGSIAGISSGTGLLQGEVLFGSLQVALGYSDLGSGTVMYPVTVGFINKFPFPLVQPYLGADFTYYLGSAAGINSMWGVEGKAGVEARLCSFGVYLGIGYGYTGVNVTGNSGMTWECGGRFYIL